ncbi:bifunctional 4-hydroxy-2-oxoglutarate aldolase/2-dehydro-3-deoxy-phosphogluconate aldolase [Agaribacterium haliotis]|uniref:bifunctional 4-hydroxy-2-oxoglutarate aldolase/2-dehydro-3-deoxy-phosphogluconate aldolase n=1 Tax=Agaribacterium haliotis TaxID=2013869 RepID=UPI000BB53616|nr:bifunctional 4-hydroxy-2-oxoglutarate aldolase/2-dehydro-3-deoxy-phosphogluconate aldolase [Agaribacterium haliotis]
MTNPTREQLRKRLLNNKFIAIIRCTEQRQVASIVANLAHAGVQALEITSNTPGWQQEIHNARAAHPELLVGAGTVRTAALAKEAASAGAQFLVTPNTNKDVVDVAHSNNLPVLMGALTPTEVADAVDYGADIVKLFPTEVFGIAYFQSLLGPFNDVAIMAVDNMSPERMTQWLKAGAAGVAVGNCLAYACTNESELKQQQKLAQDYLSRL